MELDIVTELSARKPLCLPARFEEAHRLVMRSLEVLDRNNARAAKLPNLGPLTPMAAFVVQLVASFIVGNHQAQVITSIRDLHIRREANASRETADRSMLRRARIDADRMLPTLKKNPLGIPTFLVGGAAASWLSSTLGRAVEGAKSKWGLIIALMVLFVLFGLLSWVVLRGAAVARHQIMRTLDAPLKALWETIGAAGRPQRDSARQFASSPLSSPAWDFGDPHCVSGGGVPVIADASQPIPCGHDPHRLRSRTSLGQRGHRGHRRRCSTFGGHPPPALSAPPTLERGPVSQG